MNKISIILIILFIALFTWSGWQPQDRFVWFLEILPVMLGGITLLATYRKFQFTPLVYSLILIHAVILVIGGHYTYELVPAGEWVKAAFDLSRNNYDRLGHLAQGFIPAMIAREVLIRCSPVKKGGWLFFLALCFCTAFSAVFEMFEWLVAISTSSEHGNAFLGMQGDPWDTQWDMFLCLCGAIIALLLLSRWHDRQLINTGA